ncbi:MAG: ATP-binding protein [Cyanobacteria bacterium J06639_1]
MLNVEPSPTVAEDAIPEGSGTWLQRLGRWWKNYTRDLRLETRLLFAATLAVSLVVSSFTFWAVDTIQKDARFSDSRFGKDLALLMAANVAPLIADGQESTVAQMSKQYYQSTSSIRYMLYANPDGQIYYGIPFSSADVKTSLTISRRIQLPENRPPLENKPLVRTHQTPQGLVTDIFVGIYENHKFLGTLGLGINPNPTQSQFSTLTRDVAIGVFMAVWVIAILGSVFNALTITQPIKELVTGVQGISAGNFQQRIKLPFGGELGQLVSNFNEMAERLQSYDEQNIEEMSAAKVKLDTLVSSIADGAILLDPQFTVLLVNPAALRILSWEGRDIVGQRVLELFPDELKAKITRPLFQVARGEIEGEQYRVLLNEPTRRVIRVMLSNVSLEQQHIVKGIVVTIQDITREATLNEAQSQFISNVSHELRTPLFNIKSFIETLYEYGDRISAEERQEFLETTNRETDRLTRLVNDVLDLSRLESGQRYRFDPTDIVQPIDQTVRSYQLNARDRDIHLVAVIDVELPPVWGNYDLLLQVFTNLVGNALKFTPSGGTVTLGAHKIYDERSSHSETTSHSENSHDMVKSVRISVTDTGIGLAPEDRDRIFDRFFRVENRVHTLEGTGLGLSIVRNILDKHHAHIELESEVGKGSTFWFDLHLFCDIEPELDSVAYDD